MNGTKKSWNPLVVILLLSGGFFALFLLISAFFFFSGAGGKAKWESETGATGLFRGGDAKVAVIELNGIILDSKKILQRLKQAEKNDSIKAVVLRLDTPGGAVAPSQEIFQAVQHFKKPIIASMGSVAASGGYYIACGAKKIFANPGTLTGSIGVIMTFVNMERLYQWAKIEPYAIKTGKFKDSGAAYRDMTPPERELLQEMVDNVLTQFKAAVQEGRSLSAAQINAVADGRIMTGAQAKEKKLIDELGTIQDAVNEAAKMAGIQGEPKVIYPSEPRRWILDYLLDPSEESRAGQGWFSRTAQSLFSRLGPFGAAPASPGPAGVSALDQLGQKLTLTLTPGVYWLWNGTY